LYALEELRHNNPTAARRYAKRTLARPNFDKIVSNGSDLGNLAAAINTKAVDNISGTISVLQFKQYLREMAAGRYNNGFVKRFFYSAEKNLGTSNSQLKQLRRLVADYPSLSTTEKKTVENMLKRQFMDHSRRSDLRSQETTGGLKNFAKNAALAFGAGYALGKIIK